MTSTQNLWSEHSFLSFDGTELFYRVRKPAINTNNSYIVIHRGHEHSGRLVSFIDDYSSNAEPAWYFAFDLRGHGRSTGIRGWAPNFETWVKDLNSFAIHLRCEYGILPQDIFLIANSVGSVMAATWVHDYAPGIKGMALAAPAFSIKLYIPFALPLLKFVAKFTNKLFVKSYVRSILLTRDKQAAGSYDCDRLITKRIAVSVLVSLFDTSRRILKDAQTIETPTIIISAGNDFVVRNSYHLLFYKKISSVQKRYVNLPGYRHALFHEKDRQLVIDEIQKFASQCNSQKKCLNLPALIPEPRSHSLQDYMELRKPSSNMKGKYYQLLRLALVSIGRMSTGISIGLEYGFDSGISLDYIYRNKPQGKWLLGRIIDFFYLNAIGWRGIRIRRIMLKENLKKIFEDIHARGQKPIVLDLAAGLGRYLFEAASEVSFPVELNVCDLSESNLKAASQIAKNLKITEAYFRPNDAFSITNSQLKNINANVIVFSGLFELFPDNRMIHQSLMKARESIMPGGYLIYTAQPWHPQIELIGRILNSHLGGRWIMRRRVQAEMDEIVAATGFDKLETQIDCFGIFTVSIAQFNPNKLHLNSKIKADMSQPHTFL